MKKQHSSIKISLVLVLLAFSFVGCSTVKKIWEGASGVVSDVLSKGEQVQTNTVNSIVTPLSK